MSVAETKPVAIARAVVVRANGKREIYYAYDPVPIWQFRRWLKRQKHLAFMRAEDKKEGP